MSSSPPSSQLHSRVFPGAASASGSLTLTLLPGARRLLELHARELPQRDDLCGAFCGALALRAAGEEVAAGVSDGVGGEAEGLVDQDAVALAAGSVISATPDPSILPFGEVGRRDYRLALPSVQDSGLSGTTVAGLIGAIAELSDGRVQAIPYAGPWTPDTLARLFDLTAACERPATLVANHATRYLWGSHPRHDQLLDYLLDGAHELGPAPDWDVGHFACVVARLEGPRGSVYALADTYPALGLAGLHVQPGERLAAALERPEGPAVGGAIAIVCIEDAPAVRAGAQTIGLREQAWDNGTATADVSADRAGGADGEGSAARETTS
jgi:Family of unknown function (DUF6885)